MLVLEIRVCRRAWEGNYVADVFSNGEIHHQAFEIEAEAGVGDGAVAKSWGESELGSNPKYDVADRSAPVAG